MATGAPWKAHAGVYTPFGDVTETIAAVDDRLVTTRSGDELELRFPSPGPVPERYERSFLLFADGFGKDMDPNSETVSTVDPVPWHGMPGYPYPGRSPVPPDRKGRIVPPDPAGLTGAIPLEIVADFRKIDETP